MGHDPGCDDPALRLARGTIQLFGWFELHRAALTDDLHRTSAHLLCHAESDDDGHAQAARALLQQLLTHELPGELGVQARLGELFLQANEVLGDRVFVEAAYSLAEGIANGAREAPGGPLCAVELAGGSCPTPQANLQAAALLARLGRRFGDRAFLELARRAVGFTLARQGDDGSWPRGEANGDRGLDRLHAGTRVASLLTLAGAGAHPGVYAGLGRALRHLVGLCFDAQGCLRVVLQDACEADLHGAAHALDALAQVAEVEPGAARGAAARATQLADWISARLHPWSLWREPALGRAGPGPVLEALVRAQALRGLPLAGARGAQGWAPAPGGIH